MWPKLCQERVVTGHMQRFHYLFTVKKTNAFAKVIVLRAKSRLCWRMEQFLAASTRCCLRSFVRSSDLPTGNVFKTNANNAPFS